MKHTALYVLLASALTLSTASAQNTYRLAFSQKDDIQIFLDGFTETNWCQESLKARVVGGAQASLDGFAQLLPKLGGLFAAQCPQASVFEWAFVDASGKKIAEGEALASKQWAYKLNESEQAKPVATVPAPQEETSISFEPKSELKAEPKVEEIEVEVTEYTTSAAEESGENKKNKSSHLEMEPADTDNKEENTQSTFIETNSATFFRPLSPFAVGEWTPPTDSQRKEITSALSARKDQNGCLLYSAFNFGTQDEYIQVVSNDLECNQKGYLNGKGTLQLMRSDGAALTRPMGVFVVNGIPFLSDVSHLHPQAIVYGSGSNYWFGLGSDEKSQSHYLLPVRVQNYDGLGMWHVHDELHVLTANSHSFKQANDISQQIDEAVAYIPQVFNSDRLNRVPIRFADNVENGLVNRYLNGVLYEIDATRTRSSYRAPYGPWSYDMKRAKNYVFEREAKAEQERQRELERERRRLEEEERIQQMRQEAQARAEQQKMQREQREQAQIEQKRLKEFQAVQKKNIAESNNLQAHIYKNFGNGFSGLSNYSRVLQLDRSYPISTLVEVTGEKGAMALVSWPYEMYLETEQKLKKGWYWVRGEQRLDASTLDKKGLPMTTVKVDADTLYACENKHCTELQDPLALYRRMISDSEWDPVQAEEKVTKAKEQGLIY